MDKDSTLATIVIPVYRPFLNEYELLSVNQCHEILGRKYPIVFVTPDNMDTDFLKRMYLHSGIINFSAKYFRDIPSYNRLMLSPEFYNKFIDSEYILIYQTDAYVFSDQLENWCRRDFDYIGAPWLPKEKYNTALYRSFYGIKSVINNMTLKQRDHKWLYYKVGNGGFSLRKVSSHIAICSAENDILQLFRRNSSDHRFNEDIFWSTEVNKCQNRIKFSYPDYKEAFRFSFDMAPEVAYKINNTNLPFGCHGWYKSPMLDFWKHIIPV